jgi:hypothetical protein
VTIKTSIVGVRLSLRLDKISAYAFELSPVSSFSASKSHSPQQEAALIHIQGPNGKGNGPA